MYILYIPTFVIFLFIGLALQNRNKGMKASRIIENVSNSIDPDFVALGHLNIDASILPM